MAWNSARVSFNCLYLVWVTCGIYTYAYCCQAIYQGGAIYSQPTQFNRSNPD